MTESESFKVVDKRRFTDEGDARAEAAEPAREPAPAKVAGESAASAPGEMPALTFSIFVQTLAQQTLLAMGLLAWPGQEKPEVNLEYARETIDVLTILQEKTKGNLDAQEQLLLDGLLYELRMAFVQVLQGAGAPGDAPLVT